MTLDQSYSARYFNGASAVPELGTVRFQNPILSFVSNQYTYTLALQNFESFSRIPKGVRFTLFRDEHKESPVLEIFCDVNDGKFFEREWIQTQKSAGGWKSLTARIRETNIFVLATIAICISTGIGFAYTKSLEYVPYLIPKDVDHSLGEKFQQEIASQLKVCEAKEANRFFELALKEFVPKNSAYKYKVSIIRRDEPNAFALSNGQIYFFSGLIGEAKNQAEVIGVLSHEIAHIEKRHHIRNLTKALGTTFAVSILIGPGLADYQIAETLTEIGSAALLLKYSRDFEREADRTSIEFLKNKNFTTKGLLTFFERMMVLEAEEEETDSETEKSKDHLNIDIAKLLSTHPATKDRIDDLKKIIPDETKAVKKEIVSKAEWEKIRTSCRN
ncbi:MAG: M48 family metallopeptidase [Leptospira sp.]|nr:M48 family metallopeptidase [Leptospira sp.]